MTQNPAHLFDRETLLEAARQRTGLNDFGDLWFIEPMDKYIESANAEGSLTADGFAAQTEVIVKGLASPELLMEVDVTAVAGAGSR